MHRPTVGIIAILLLATWAALWIWPLTWSGNHALQGACLRVGIVMGAIWIAQPQLQRVPGWMVTLGTIMAIFVALQPRRLVVFVPLLIVFYFLRPRKKAKKREGEAPRQPASRV